MNYELHITMEDPEPFKVKTAVEALQWKFSKIDGDPIMGEGIKCYATNYSNAELKEVIKWIEDTADQLSSLGCNVIRRKIEKTIYDRKSL